METRTYTEKSNARRAAKSAGVDFGLITETEDGFTFPLPTSPDVDDPTPTPLKQAIGLAVEKGITPKGFVAIAETVADGLDIPSCLQRPPLTEAQRAELDAKVKRRNSPERNIEMPKRTTPAKKDRAKTGDKVARLITMLGGKGSTVEAMTKALDWLPHTLRARISRLVKSKAKGGEGLKIDRTRVDGVTSYKLT